MQGDTACAAVSGSSGRDVTFGTAWRDSLRQTVRPRLRFAEWRSLAGGGLRHPRFALADKIALGVEHALCLQFDRSFLGIVIDSGSSTPPQDAQFVQPFEDCHIATLATVGHRQNPPSREMRLRERFGSLSMRYNAIGAPL